MPSFTSSTVPTSRTSISARSAAWIAEQVGRAGGAGQIDDALEIGRAARGELTGQVLPRDTERGRYVAGLGRKVDATQDLFPGRELQAVRQAQQLRRVRQRLA